MAFGVAADHGSPRQLPALPDVELWQDILWPECGKLTLDQVAEFIEADGSIETLAAKLKGKDAHAVAQ